MIAILRAGHQYLRAFTYIGAAAVDSLGRTDSIWATVAAHKTELLGLIDASTGDGNFRASVDRNPAARRASIRLTGKSVGDVWPMAGLVPLVVAIFRRRHDDRSLAPAGEILENVCLTSHGHAHAPRATRTPTEA